jgi:hypothetical protein
VDQPYRHQTGQRRFRVAIDLPASHHGLVSPDVSLHGDDSREWATLRQRRANLSDGLEWQAEAAQLRSSL